MPSEPKRTEPINAIQLKAVADALNRMSETATKAAAIAQKQSDKALAVYNWPSAQTGLTRLKSFIHDVEAAMTLAEIGAPRVVGQLKPRSTAKTRPTIEDLKAVKSEHKREAKPSPKRRKQG